MSKGPISIGAILLVAGIADHAYAAPKAALCRTGIGEFGQALDPSLAKDCSTYTTMEHAVGWLIGGGIALLVIGIIWLAVALGVIGTQASRSRKNGASSRQARPGAMGAPAAPGAAGPYGGTPAPYGGTPAPAPFPTPAQFGAFGEPQDPNTRG